MEPSQEERYQGLYTLIEIISILLIGAFSVWIILFVTHRKTISPSSITRNTIETNVSASQLQYSIAHLVNSSYYPPNIASKFMKTNNIYSVIWTNFNDIILGRVIATAYPDETFDIQISIRSRRKVDTITPQIADTLVQTYFNPQLSANRSWQCGKSATMELCTATIANNTTPYEFFVYRLPLLQNDGLIVLCSYSKQNPLYGTINFCLPNDEKRLFHL